MSCNLCLGEMLLIYSKVLISFNFDFSKNKRMIIHNYQLVIPNSTFYYYQS